jgi:ABC-type metal ion transport system substrate-binding protein
MKKIIYILLTFLVLFTSCVDSNEENSNNKIQVENNEEVKELTTEETITKEVDEEVEVEIGELI